MKKLLCLVASSLLLGGCGGGDGTLADDVAVLTSPFVVLNLSDRTYTMRLAIDDLATGAAYRDNLVVFRRVTVGSNESFVAVFELSQAQWSHIAGTTPWSTVDPSVVPAVGVAGDRPAFNIDYDSASLAMSQFVLPAGRIDLPTAAEWTAACGVTSGWSIGANPDVVQFKQAAVVRETASSAGGPQPVGARAANSMGFYDLHGNVWEWTKPGDVIRGGSWHDPAWSSRAEIAVGTAQGMDTLIPHALVGVRLVLVQ